MKTREFEGIDYRFRPDSYREVADPLETILLNVKGTNRRRMIRDYWKLGKLDELGRDLSPGFARRRTEAQAWKDSPLLHGR
jgi:hypothetical protein